MARVNAPTSNLFKVVFTEYERGWGQKHWDTDANCYNGGRTLPR